MDSYIFIKKTHRVSNPRDNSYENWSKYVERMGIIHGLVYDPLCPFDKENEKISSFRVDDVGKALSFVFVYSEFVEKPDKLI